MARWLLTLSSVIIAAGPANADSLQHLGKRWGAHLTGLKGAMARRKRISTAARQQVSHVAHHLRNSVTSLGGHSMRLVKELDKELEPRSGQRKHIDRRRIIKLKSVASRLTKMAQLFESRIGALDKHVTDHPPVTEAQLERLDQDIDRMLGVVNGLAHEMITSTHHLERLSAGRPAVQREKAVGLHQNAQRVMELGSGAAALRKAGRLRRVERTDVAALVRRQVEAARRGAPEGTEVLFQGPRDRAQAVVGIKRLSQAVDELLANALRAVGEKGKITVTVTIRPTGVVIAVKDNGGGIPEGERDALLASLGLPFIGSERSGFGLARVNAIAEAHGGAAYLKNSPGKGVTVMLVIPREREPN